MNSEVIVDSLTISKSDPSLTNFRKYDIEAAINEIENLENYSIYKYSFTILSDPKNVRVSAGGVTKVFGKPAERDEILEKNENNVPKILSLIYRELFPMFFIMSKSVAVPCPPYHIAELDVAQQKNIDEIPETEPVFTKTSFSEKTLEPAPLDSGESLQIPDDPIGKFEDMPDEKLSVAHQKISPESTTQSVDLQAKLDQVSQTLNKRNDASVPDNVMT